MIQEEENGPGVTQDATLEEHNQRNMNGFFLQANFQKKGMVQ